MPNGQTGYLFNPRVAYAQLSAALQEVIDKWGDSDFGDNTSKYDPAMPPETGDKRDEPMLVG